MVSGMMCMIPRLKIRPAERQLPRETKTSICLPEKELNTTSGRAMATMGMTASEAAATRAIQSSTSESFGPSGSCTTGGGVVSREHNGSIWQETMRGRAAVRFSKRRRPSLLFPATAMISSAVSVYVTSPVVPASPDDSAPDDSAMQLALSEGSVMYPASQ